MLIDILLFLFGIVIGVVAMILYTTYHKKPDTYGGDLIIGIYDDGERSLYVSLTKEPQELAKEQYVTFKVITQK